MACRLGLVNSSDPPTKGSFNQPDWRRASLRTARWVRRFDTVVGRSLTPPFHHPRRVPVQKRETMVANYYATDEGKTTKTAAKPAPDGDRRGRRALVGLALVAALALASCRHQVTAQVGLLGGDSLLKEPPSSSVSSSPENTVCEDDTICKTFGKYSCWEDCVLGCGSTLRSWVPRYSTRIFWDCKCYCSALGANGDTCYDSKNCESGCCDLYFGSMTENLCVPNEPTCHNPPPTADRG